MQTALETATGALRQGDLMMITDDMARQTSYLVGLAEHVTPDNVNTMIKVGKGLVYVSVPESKAEQLQLPPMVQGANSYQEQIFTVSVDHISSTTGISAFERARTIQAIAASGSGPDDFVRPGHIFPLVAKERGLLERVDVVEASVDLARACSGTSVAYLCEVLNEAGEIAGGEELLSIAAAYGFPVVKLSEMMRVNNGRTIACFTGTVIPGRRIGRKIGFPTANLDIVGGIRPLNRGAYGVKVRHNLQEYIGMMSVGVRPTFVKDTTMSHYEVHIFNFDQDVYGHAIEVDVLFYMREETSFPTVDHLVSQLHQDKQQVLQRMELIHANE